MARIKVNSRLGMSELISYEGIEFWDTVVLPEIPHNDEDIEHEVQEGERIDTIAQKYYGDSVLWWYIAIASEKELFPVELSPGDRLRIPPVSYLSTYLGQVRSD